jgi:4'-phosphopantetheinyl transferase
MNAFKFERNQREYLATRTLVRTSLSALRPIVPEAWRFQANCHGKPFTNPDCGLRFNLSNSLGLVVCLIAEGTEVGVDVEPEERARQIAEVAHRVFSPQELQQREALSDEQKLERGLLLWTLKESYIKARGMGLAIPLDKFSFVFGGRPGIHLELDPSLGDDASRWRFCLLKHAKHRVALMAEVTQDPQLQMRESRPLLDTPANLELRSEPWFPLR